MRNRKFSPETWKPQKWFQSNHVVVAALNWRCPLILTVTCTDKSMSAHIWSGYSCGKHTRHFSVRQSEPTAGHPAGSRAPGLDPAHHLHPPSIRRPPAAKALRPTGDLGEKATFLLALHSSRRAKMWADTYLPGQPTKEKPHEALGLRYRVPLGHKAEQSPVRRSPQRAPQHGHQLRQKARQMWSSVFQCPLPPG